MPTQADIRNYIVPANNNVESTSQVMNLADSVHSEFVRQVMEQFIEGFNRSLTVSGMESRLTEQQVEHHRSQILQNQKLIEKLDQMMLERDDLKNRLNDAERASTSALDEVAALRDEINELKKALSQRQDTMRDSDHEVEDPEDVHQSEDRSEGDEVNINDGGNQTILPENVTPEVLSAMVTNHQREDDCYWRSSLMITVGSGEFGDFKSWRHKLYCMGLHFLYHETVSHYVTGRGNLRLTYRSEYEMRMKIIQARRFCKDRNLRNIHVEFMVPPRFVQEKKKMMKSERQMKANGLIGVYDCIIKWGQPVLRTFSQTQGVQYLKANEIPEENVTYTVD